MPAIQVLGCCSSLGTWSSACRGAEFLQLSSKTCWEAASGSPRVMLALLRMQQILH